MFSRYTFRGRRRSNRRAGEARQGYYVDWSDGPYRSLVVGIGFFILIDAVATLEILSRGGNEANPLMARILSHSLWSFLLVKFTGAFTAVFVLAVHRHFPRVRQLGLVLMAAYGSLAIYHLFLLIRSAA
jgi:hypothetical protein